MVIFFFLQIKRVKKHEHEDTILCTAREKRILFHPKSVVSKTKKFPYSWVVFHTKQKSSQVCLDKKRRLIFQPFFLLYTITQYSKVAMRHFFMLKS